MGRKPYIPYKCPSCGADLQQPGSIIFWRLLPEKAPAHLEPGESDGIIIILDGGEEEPETDLQCSECGTGLNKFKIEDVDLSPEFEKIED